MVSRIEQAPQVVATEAPEEGGMDRCLEDCLEAHSASSYSEEADDGTDLDHLLSAMPDARESPSACLHPGKAEDLSLLHLFFETLHAAEDGWDQISLSASAASSRC